MMRLVQISHPSRGRKIAVVEDNRLRMLSTLDSVYRLAWTALATGANLEQTAAADFGKEHLEYDKVLARETEWTLLPAFDHPEEPARCLVTGTGLTHQKSAQNRQSMHALAKGGAPTDSMKMYEMGLAGGKPAAGTIGVAPEWFYKGCGTILRAHGEPLEVPAFGLDGGEESEVAGAYIIDATGAPRRVGLVLANEFSDHKMEEQNYLCLAPSKLRTCSIGPELIVGGEFQDNRGTAKVLRQDKAVWLKPFATGEANMCHTVANLEHHHFKYEAHRRPGDAHIHFFGADAFSFGAGVALADGDVMVVAFEGFGRPLRNPLQLDRKAEERVEVAAV